MNQNIHNISPRLLEAYLDDLKAEADTVAHIVKYINDSMAARAGLAEKLETNLRALRDKSASTSSLTKELA